MKTIEEINGQKVLAIDSDGSCIGCMYYIYTCRRPRNEDGTLTHCTWPDRYDKRNVIFQLYEQKNTYTLSQINDVIDKLVRYSAFNHKSSFEDIIDVLNQFKNKLEQL